MTFPLPSQKPPSSRASALVITLFAVAIVTILTVTLLMVARYERTSSALALGKARSEALADLAADMGVAQIKAATQDGMSTAADKMWVSEPGRIRVYDRANLGTHTDYNLFSALPGNTDNVNNVDLNRPSLGKEYPIAPPAPGRSGATMKVGWINLVADPANPASASNRVVGRVAYWVDDESCKVNINTADGSHKADLYRVIPPNETSKSFGFGTPSEISLEALKNTYNSGGANLGKTVASAINDYAWKKGFNSAAEIGRIPNLPADFYRNNKFNITYYSKTPELTFHGGPRIYLMPVVPSGSATWTALTGPYASATNNADTWGSGVGERIDFVYPTSKQLPGGAASYVYPAGLDVANGQLPQYFLGVGGQEFKAPGNNPNFSLALRIAKALAGKKSDDSDIVWPAFNGTNDYADKYNPRQIDSIALQIVDISNTTVFADHIRSYSLPTIALNGIANTTSPARERSVIGVGRGPKLTEVFMEVTPVMGNPYPTANYPGPDLQQVQMRIITEFYFPKYYQGTPLNHPYTLQNALDWRFGNSRKFNFAGNQQLSTLNDQDLGPDVGSTSPLGTKWADSLLRAETSPGVSAGLDFAGNPYYLSKAALPSFSTYLADPSPANAAAYHPFSNVPSKSTHAGAQALTTGGARRPVLQMADVALKSAVTTPSWNKAWLPGVYLSQDDANSGALAYPLKPGVTGFSFAGGIALWTRNETTLANWGNWEVAPLDSLRGTEYTGENPVTISAALQQAVIPVNFAVSLSSITRYSVQVTDPLVNKFPADWQIANPTIGNPSSATSEPALYIREGPTYTDPAFPNPGLSAPTAYDGGSASFRPSGSGDPLSLWLPRQDVRYPKQSRFPSVGALNYVRTGMIPEGANLGMPLSAQHGTPWRSINLSNTNQGVYPDWAMLDLFTVPFIPQSIYYIGGTAPPKRKLTYGGATEGKLNINNPLVPYPFNLDAAVNDSPPERTAPLEALFYGIQVQNSYDGTDKPVDTVVDAAALRTAIQSHLAANGPFVLPGQLAEVPAVNSYTYSGVPLSGRSRNDLMRQVVGATTTQSNVFSIWITAQTIRKNPRNTQYGVFETGDTVTGETRRRYIIERHLDYGKDGVPGNAVSPGPDGVVGTADDPTDPVYHPTMGYPLPYRWKIVSVEDIPY